MQNMMMKILAFDPSLSNWGYSIANYHNNQLDILDYGVIQTKPSNSKERQNIKDFNRCQYLYQQLLPLVKSDILRCELVVQRDGLPSGRALFKCDVERRRCVEFTKEQRKQYDELYSDTLDKIMKGQKGNPDANEEKYNKKQGDI